MLSCWKSELDLFLLLFNFFLVVDFQTRGLDSDQSTFVAVTMQSEVEDVQKKRMHRTGVNKHFLEKLYNLKNESIHFLCKTNSCTGKGKTWQAEFRNKALFSLVRCLASQIWGHWMIEGGPTKSSSFCPAKRKQTLEKLLGLICDRCLLLQWSRNVVRSVIAAKYVRNGTGALHRVAFFLALKFAVFFV